MKTIDKAIKMCDAKLATVPKSGRVFGVVNSNPSRYFWVDVKSVPNKAGGYVWHVVSTKETNRRDGVLKGHDPIELHGYPQKIEGRPVWENDPIYRAL